MRQLTLFEASSQPRFFAPGAPIGDKLCHYEKVITHDKDYVVVSWNRVKEEE